MPVLVEGVPASKWALSDAGVKDSSALADELRSKFTLDPTIYASVEPKAEETAAVLAERLGLALKTEARFREFDRPVLPIMSPADHRRLNRQIFEDLHQKVIGNESGQMALKRFSEGIREMVGSPIEGARMVVCHGTVISLFVAEHNSVDSFDLWKQLECPSYVQVSLPDFQLIEVRASIEGGG